VTKRNIYSQIIEKIFLSYYKKGIENIEFERSDIEKFANRLKISIPKNLGDLIYSFRYRASLPEKIQKKSPKGKTWIIRPAGRAKYKFALIDDNPIVPNSNLAETKIPDATPGIVSKYSLNDEQALLAIIRYNRLIDIFTGVTCYSLQNHLRTTVSGMGQVETDELYVGLNKKGAHFIFPVQAKGGKDRLNIVQIEQDFAVCESKFSDLICRAIGTQFMEDDLIALFEFEQSKKGIVISSEKHYLLVPPEEISAEDLEIYRKRKIN